MFAPDIKYATKVWLFSVITSPLVFMIFRFNDLATSNADFLAELGGFLLMFVLFGGLISIPCWLAFMLFVRLISRMEQPNWNKKMMIQVVALVIGSVPFILMFGWQEVEILLMTLPYLITLSFAIWYYRLDNLTKMRDVNVLDDLLT